MEEEWRVVEEAPRYLVSNLGRVMNEKTGRILRPGINSDGYCCVVLSLGGRQTISRKVHRLVALEFLECPDLSYQVNHINTVKTDNYVENLEWTTQLENMRHAFRHGIFTNRTGGGTPKTPVRIIETGEVFESQRACARAIGGNQQNINACLTGRIKRYFGYTYEYVDKR